MTPPLPVRKRDPRPVLWGGRRGDVQIGSREDVWACVTLARQARIIRAAEQLRAVHGEVGAMIAYQRESNVLQRERLLARDRMLYGFAAVDQHGERIDPMTLLPLPAAAVVSYYAADTIFDPENAHGKITNVRGDACPCGGDWTLCEGCPDA